MSKITYRFTATLNRPQGAHIFKGTAEGCPTLDLALLTLRELLKANNAFEPEVTSIKITISPVRRKSKS